MRLNVLTQTKKAPVSFVIPILMYTDYQSNAKLVFIQRNIFISKNVKLCGHHLNNNGVLLSHLLLGLRFVNRPYVIRGPELQVFLQSLREMAISMTGIEDENGITDKEFKYYCLVTKAVSKVIYVLRQDISP